MSHPSALDPTAPETEVHHSSTADNGKTQAPATFTISDKAAHRIAEMKRAKGDDGLFLRVAVNGGGCSGFQYAIGFDRTVNDDDVIFECHGSRVVVDGVSLDLLEGSTVDYVEELIGSSFQVLNPNAASSCGCGTSFSL